MIPSYPKGSDLSLINVIYRRGTREGKYKDDFILITYRDNETKETKHHIIYQPEYTFYLVKEPEDYCELYRKNPEVTPVTCKFSELLKTVAEVTGNIDSFITNIRDGNFRLNYEFHKLPSVMGSDEKIEDHYIKRFRLMYESTDMTITKSFLDIEVDGINALGDFPDMGECPINAITTLFEDRNMCCTFLLREGSNPLIEQFEKDLASGKFHQKLMDDLLISLKSESKIKKHGIDKIDFKIFMYDSEIELIRDMFIMINGYKPNFLLAWNMAFDIPYIIERLKEIGYNPEDIICSPEIEESFCKYHEDYPDSESKFVWDSRGDWFEVSSNTVYVDQLIHHKSIRKGHAQTKSSKLDYIADIIAGVRKLDYSHITKKIAELPYKDYNTFVSYNIIDTIAQKCIEDIARDIDFIYVKSMMNNTRYHKVHRQTTYLKNRIGLEFNQMGLVLGNNVNGNNQHTPYPGGMIVEVGNNDKKYANQINNVHTRMYLNCIDYDYSSQYPSTYRQMNFSPTTLIAKIILDDVLKEDKEFEYLNKLNPLKDADYNSGGGFLEDIISTNYITLGTRWFNLATFEQLYDDIIYYHDVVKGSDAFAKFMHKNGGLYAYKVLKDDFNISPYNINKNDPTIPYISGFKGIR